MRHACAATERIFVEEVQARAAGLLVAASNPDTQAGIIALAVMLRCNPDALIAVARSVKVVMVVREFPPSGRVALVEAPCR